MMDDYGNKIVKDSFGEVIEVHTTKDQGARKNEAVFRIPVQVSSKCEQCSNETIAKHTEKPLN